MNQTLIVSCLTIAGVNVPTTQAPTPLPTQPPTKPPTRPPTQQSSTYKLNTRPVESKHLLVQLREIADHK